MRIINKKSLFLVLACLITTQCRTTHKRDARSFNKSVADLQKGSQTNSQSLSKRFDSAINEFKDSERKNTSNTINNFVTNAQNMDKDDFSRLIHNGGCKRIDNKLRKAQKINASENNSSLHLKEKVEAEEENDANDENKLTKTQRDLLTVGLVLSAVGSLVLASKWAKTHKITAISSLSERSPQSPQKNQIEYTVAEAQKIIENHIKKRFTELRSELKKAADFKVTIPTDDQSITHTLAKKGGLAQRQWNDYARAVGESPNLGEDAYKKTKELLDTEVNSLIHDYPNQIERRFVDQKFATAKNYQVWGANSSNWNYPNNHSDSDSFGGGQASHFSKQIKGVFGIVTTPLTGLDGVNPETETQIIREKLTKKLENSNFTPQQKQELQKKIKTLKVGASDSTDPSKGLREALSTYNKAEEVELNKTPTKVSNPEISTEHHSAKNIAAAAADRYKAYTALGATALFATAAIFVSQQDYQESSGLSEDSSNMDAEKRLTSKLDKIISDCAESSPQGSK